MPSRRILVRPPSPRLADGLVTHIERTPVDVARAREQWARYVEAFANHGWEVIEVPAADECPDGVFVEDTMVVYDDLAVIARPGAVERRPEIIDAASTVEAAGYRTAAIAAPATLDGGDVLKIGNRILVGSGGRTNGAGIRQLGAYLAPLGAEVVAVSVTKVLHLKSAVTALPDQTVIGYPPLVDDPGFFGRFEAMPEAAGSHVVLLDDESVLMADSAPRSAQQLEEKGLRVVRVDIGEFERLEGCVTCLSVRLRGRGHIRAARR